MVLLAVLRCTKAPNSIKGATELNFLDDVRFNI